MSLQYTLRLLLVCVTFSVVGCFPEVSIGDVTENYPKIKMQALEHYKKVDPRIQNPIKSTLQRNVEQFNSRYQWPRYSSDPYSPKTLGDVRNLRFSPITAKASADVLHYQNTILSSVSSRNNPVELSNFKHDNRLDAKGSSAFQTVQQSPAHFTGSQRSTSDNNLAPRLVKKYGLVNEMYAGNVYRLGSFGNQHIFKSNHSQPLKSHKPNLRENAAFQVIRPAHAERIESDYMFRSSTANHNMRLKSDGNAMFDQNYKVLRRVVPASTSLSMVEPNQQGHKSSPHSFSTETAIISQIVSGNTREPLPSKMLTPTIVPIPSNSNQGHLILPFKKAMMFSSEHDLIQQSDSRRVAFSQANTHSSFENGKIKFSRSSYTLKDVQLTSAQKGYHKVGQSGQNVGLIETLHTQRYDNMAGKSGNIPLMTDDVLSYKRFLSDKNSSIRSQTSSLPDQSMQGMHMTSRKLFPKNTMLFWERDKSINPPDTTNHSLRKSSQHNTRIGTDLNSSGQSTVQSLFVKNDPVPTLVPGNTMKIIYSVSPSVSVIYKNADVSRGQNHPYYLTSKKPYAFKGFMFVPTVQRYLQKTEVLQLRKKPLTNSNLHTTQMALIPDRKEKTIFQFEDTKTSREEQPDRDNMADSINNRTQLSFKEEENNDVPNHHVVKGQAVAMSGKNTSNNEEVPLWNYLKTGFDEVQSKKSQTDSIPNEMPIESSSNGRFVGSDTHPSTTKFTDNHENHKSELVLPIKKSSLINKADGNAVIHPFRRFYYKEQEGPSNPEKDRNSAGVTQSGTRPKSTIVVGKQDEVAKEGNRSRENSSSQNVFSFQGPPIYRSADVKSHKSNNLSTTHRSAVKLLDRGIETKIDFSAVGVSQSLSPTSSVVVGRLVNMFDKVSNKTSLNASSTKTSLNNFKPVQSSDITGSASFAKVETRSYTGMKVVDVISFTNRSDSTVMEEMTNSSSMPLKDDVQSPVNINKFEIIPTAATDIGTEENTQPQTTLYSIKPQLDQNLLTKENTDLFNEGILIHHTTSLVTVTS